MSDDVLRRQSQTKKQSPHGDVGVWNGRMEVGSAGLALWAFSPAALFHRAFFGIAPGTGGTVTANGRGGMRASDLTSGRVFRILG